MKSLMIEIIYKFQLLLYLIIEEISEKRNINEFLICIGKTINKSGFYNLLDDSQNTYIEVNIYIYIRGSLYKFPHFFCMGTFIDSTRMKL